jgi:hypothetical protein
MTKDQDCCWLQGFGECRGKLNDEHYISRGILEDSAAGNKTAIIGGLKFQPTGTLQRIGIGSLVTKIYCDGHNSGFSPLDQALKSLLKTLHAIDKAPALISTLTTFEGRLIERTLLKMVVGLTAVNHGRAALRDEWKPLLVGGDWPDGWGLYLAEPKGAQVFDDNLLYEAHVRPQTNVCLAASFHLNGLYVHLMLAKPDRPRAWGLYRPRGCIFHLVDGSERRVELLWPHSPEHSLHLTRLPFTTGEGSPRTSGWNGPDLAKRVPTTEHQ